MSRSGVRSPPRRAAFLPGVGPDVELPQVAMVVIPFRRGRFAPEDVYRVVVIHGRVGASRRGVGRRGQDARPLSNRFPIDGAILVVVIAATASVGGG